MELFLAAPAALLGWLNLGWILDDDDDEKIPWWVRLLIGFVIVFWSVVLGLWLLQKAGYFSTVLPLLLKPFQWLLELMDELIKWVGSLLKDVLPGI